MRQVASVRRLLNMLRSLAPAWPCLRADAQRSLRLRNLYLVPVAFHFDAIAAHAGKIGAWAFTGLYAVWGVLLDAIRAKRESVTAQMLTLWRALLLGVTNVIATDVGSLPLIWVLPLLIYLFSFILLFGRRPIDPPWIRRWHSWPSRSAASRKCDLMPSRPAC